MSGSRATYFRRPFASWLLLLLMSALVGCKVGPNYAPPTPHVPETWSQETPPEIQLAPQYDLMDTSWWTVFRDPALDSLIFEAANTNLDLVRTGRPDCRITLPAGAGERRSFSAARRDRFVQPRADQQ